jgi:tetratricopeptide (TPR) repeat protein
MAKISLRNYNHIIENLIENGQHDDAIAHCRHILQTFPKYIEAYRLLGKAYLEAKRYDDAVDIFQRVLMSVPDDFVSNVGLSIIADEHGKLDDAIWHMERAFEVQPSNAAIQGELQRLFGRRDGIEPPKIRLTRGALAHMYIQGELYTQAVSEIGGVLATDADRVDMQVLLAKAYHYMGQKAEASDACSQLLKRYPYCLDANRILVEILPGTQRAESTQVYRHRVIELDPYSAFVKDSIFRSDQVADAAVSLDQLETTSQPASDADWKNGLAIGLASDATLASSSASSSELDWLKQVGDVPAASPKEEPAPVSQSQNEIPDFMRQAGWGESTGEFNEAQSTVPDQGEVAPAVQADLPDWLKAMAPTEETPSEESVPSTDDSVVFPDIPELATTIPASSAKTPSPATNPPKASASEIPDWMKKIDQVQGAPTQSIGESASTIPEWMQNLDQNPTAPVTPSQPVADSSKPAIATTQSVPAQPASVGNDPLGALGTSAQEQDDAMAWLESLAAKHGAKAEELVTDPNARTDVAPDWVDKAKAIGETQPVTPAPAAHQMPDESSLDLTGVWLRNLESSGAETPTAQNDQGESKSSDWFKESAADEPVAETPAANEKESLDWFNERIANEPIEQTPATDSQEPPAWLKEMENEQPQAKSEEPSQPVDLQAWLAGLDKEELPSPSPAASAADEELPAWLANEPQPEATEPTQPEEWHPAESEPQVVESTQPTMDRSVAVEPPEPLKPVKREISIEVEQPQPVKRSAPKAQPKPSKPARKVESGASLEGAQAEMGRGNIAAAIEVYTKLIRKGKSLDEIIRDLRDALYRFPVEVPLWQTLGDAYMRSNRLQEALDAYTKAEELLR